MSIVVPPKGTRGSGFPKPVRALMRATQGVFHMAFERFGDRMRVQGRPLVMLETIGGRTGAPRQVVLGSFPDVTADAAQSATQGAERWIVVASNAGSSRHPAWFLNLAKDPDRVWVVKGKRRIKVKPETLAGAERERAWQQVTTLAPGYARYEQTTDRSIPIVRLKAVE